MGDDLETSPVVSRELMALPDAPPCVTRTDPPFDLSTLVADSRDLAAHELQRTIVDAAASFSGGELEDDLTLVVVCVAEASEHEASEKELAVVV